MENKRESLSLLYNVELEDSKLVSSPMVSYEVSPLKDLVFDAVGWETWFFSVGVLHVFSPHGLVWAFSQCGGRDPRTNIPKVRESQDKLYYALTQLWKSHRITSTISTGWSSYQTLTRFMGKEYFPPLCGKNVSHIVRRAYRNTCIYRCSHIYGKLHLPQ